MSERIKYPIAIYKPTGELISAVYAKNGNECECKCHFCDENMIAVNNGKKQKAHFRHLPKTKCTANYETFIHWVAKKLISNAGKIKLPKLHITQTKIMKELKNVIDSKYSNIDFEKYFIDQFEFCVQDEILVEFYTVFEEKEYKTKFGIVRPDIVIVIEEVELFIEPFYLNKIDEEKLQKIRELDVSVISINLLDYVKAKGFCFELKEFEDYLINQTYNKAWINVRQSKVESISVKYRKMIAEWIKKHDSNLKRLSTIEATFSKMDSREKEIKNELHEIQKSKNQLQEQKSNILRVIGEPIPRK